jgi:hypothetical protein
MSNLPRIRGVKVAGPTALEVKWAAGGTDRIDLAGWIATGGSVLAPLRDPAVFRRARAGDFGASVEWGENDDLAIDAVHLARIAGEQRDLGSTELSDWQASNDFSNSEAAEFVGVSRSTWAAYKAGDARVPAAIVMTIRATQRDPILLHAHYRPLRGRPGRPRKQA